MPWTFGYDHRYQLVWTEKRVTDSGTLQKQVDFKYEAWGNRIESRTTPTVQEPGPRVRFASET